MRVGVGGAGGGVERRVVLRPLHRLVLVHGARQQQAAVARRRHVVVRRRRGRRRRRVVLRRVPVRRVSVPAGCTCARYLLPAEHTHRLVPLPLPRAPRTHPG